MMTRNPTLTIAGFGLLGVFALPAQAAPPTGADLAAAVSPSSIDKASYYGRNCWRRHGQLYCNRYVRRGYPYANYDSWGPGYGYGYGPGLGFYFGGGGYRGNHWGGHHGGRRHW